MTARVTTEALPGMQMAVEMEQLDRCILCGSERVPPLLRASRVHPTRHSGPKFNVARCAQCGLTFTNPRPSGKSIGAFYDGYFDEYIRTSSGIYERRAREVAEVLDGRTPGRVLDIGCGTGNFLVEMQRLGWTGVGVEPDPVAAGFASSELGLDVKQGTLDSVQLDGDFDLITLWHTLEHLHDPIGYLQTCRRLLKPDGVLVIEVPNFGSLQARCFRSSWCALMVPEHLWHFTPPTLLRLAAMSGFKLSRLDHSFDRAGWGTSARIALSDLKFKLRKRPASAPEAGRRSQTATAPAKPRAGIIDRVQEAVNRAGFFVESRLFRYHIGTLAMRAFFRKGDA